jgi:3-deoxy-D-manno-octulosonic-acid transferase
MLWRLKHHNEDFKRFAEKFGCASKNKPFGPIIWLHGASVGESLMALNLIKNLQIIYPNYYFLITSGTKTSVNIIEKSNIPNLIHQYTPLDIDFSTKWFIDYWRPQLGIFIESEIWPNLIYNASKKFPLILANGSMSDLSFSKWKYVGYFLSSILNKFALIIARNQSDLEKFKALGAKNVEHLGNLKFSTSKPIVDELKFEHISKQLLSRKTLFAASTHEGDEQIILNCYKNLKLQHPDLLLLIAPRHPSRTTCINHQINQQNLVSSIRTIGDYIENNTDVYIINTLGELGMFYSLATISFIGGSFKNGGHNLIEAAFFNTLIIFGPDMSNFAEIADEFVENLAAIRCQDLEQITQVCDDFLSQPEKINTYNQAAKKILAAKENILGNYLKKISKFIN